MTTVRTVRVGEPSHSVVHDGYGYEFHSKSLTLGDLKEWLPKASDRDPSCRDAILDINGSSPDQYADEILDACVGELKRYYDDQAERIRDGFKNLAATINKPFLDFKPFANVGQGLRLGNQDHRAAPLLVPLSPADRVVDATQDLPDRLREEEVPVAHASLRWVRDKVLPGLIVGLFMFGLGWAANEFFG